MIEEEEEEEKELRGEGEEEKKKRRRRRRRFFKRCIFDAFFFIPACAKVPVRTMNSNAQSISPASCRSKRVDDHNRFYANFRDFRGARVSTCRLAKQNMQT